MNKGAAHCGPSQAHTGPGACLGMLQWFGLVLAYGLLLVTLNRSPNEASQRRSASGDHCRLGVSRIGDERQGGLLG
jgi:hypothetical protein